MPSPRLELMYDHVRAIHRALTGEDPPERAAPEGGLGDLTPERVASHFAELEALARAIPSVAERVPPFSFTPPLDVIGTERELVFELGVPGIDAGDVHVELANGWLVVSGARAGEAPPERRIYLHAVMPRGPFRRAVELQSPTAGAPRLEVDRGIVRVRIAKSARSALPRA
jgi:HSP20 family protein